MPTSPRQSIVSGLFLDLKLKVTRVILIFNRQSFIRDYLSDVIRFLDHRILSSDNNGAICSAF